MVPCRLVVPGRLGAVSLVVPVSVVSVVCPCRYVPVSVSAVPVSVSGAVSVSVPVSVSVGLVPSSVVRLVPCRLVSCVLVCLVVG